jgi:hypothetical protein
MSIPLLLTAVVLAGGGDAPLSPALARQVEPIVAAYYEGDSVGVREVLVPIVTRWRDEQIAAVDAALADRDIPSIRELLLAARMSLMRQNLTSALPEPGVRERLLTLEALREEWQGILQSKNEHPLLAGAVPEPQNLEEYEERAWDIHVLQNLLLTAERSTQYARELADGLSPSARRRLKPADRETVEAAASSRPIVEVDRAQRKLEEVEMVLRLERLDYGLQVLADPKLRKERMMAAYSTVVDGRILSEFFKKIQDEQRPLVHEELKGPDLPREVAEKIERARELAGPLAERAQELFDGLHWWLRGRYGSGPELGGLAKSAASLENPNSLVWIYMPKSRPMPRSPAFDEPGVPRCERRHHDTWAWEDRRVQHSVIRRRSRKNEKLEMLTSAFW